MTKKKGQKKEERALLTIDATNQSLGRLAVKVATLLRGKQKPSYVPYRDQGEFVVIQNLNKAKATGRKWDQKKYYRHSGYIGSLKERTLKQEFELNPEKAFKHIIWGMLPKNKLRKEQIKRLTVKN